MNYKLFTIAAIIIAASILVHCEANAAADHSVFLIPHSHMDPGWEITQDEYYKLLVKNIYDSVVEALTDHPSRKFIAVEMAFISQWFEDSNTTDLQRAQFKKLVNLGQIEIVGGGWVMHDEAVVEWQSAINQLTLGHQWALNNIGEDAKPQFGWSIDPFGHGFTNPTLLSLCGYDAYVVGRFNSKDKLSADDSLQFIWRASESLGSSTEIWTHVMPFGYSCPFWMQWDFGAPKVDDLTILPLSIAFRDDNAARFNKMHDDTIMFAFGNDFEFINATKQFENMDKLKGFIDDRPQEFNNTNIHYASLLDYMSEIYERNATWPVRTVSDGDSFPLGKGSTGAWSGFYASRPLLKRTQRAAEGLLALAERLVVAAAAWSGSAIQGLRLSERLHPLRAACAVVNHHDAITGTETPHVVLDYMKKLNDGADEASNVVTDAVNLLIDLDGPSHSFTLGLDSLLSIKPNTTIPVFIFNSLGWREKSVVKAPTGCDCEFEVTNGHTGERVVSQVVPAFINSSVVAPYELHWETDVPALGFVVYFVKALAPAADQTDADVNDVFSIENDKLGLTFKDGRLNTVNVKSMSLSIDADVEFWKYPSSEHSGAYVFYPEGAAEQVVDPLSQVEVQIVEGPLLSCVHQTFVADKYLQSVCLRHIQGEDDSIFIDQRVGEIEENAEIVTRWRTSMDTNGVFTTDSMGRDTTTRKNDPDTPIQSNFYPAVHSFTMRDTAKDVQFTSISDYSMGVASLDNGQFECMVHRRPMGRDGKGLMVPVNDTTVVYPRYRVQFAHTVDAVRSRHANAQKFNFPLSLLSAPSGDPDADYRVSGSVLNQDLPDNVHLASFAFLPGSNSNLLLRLAHMYEVSEDPGHGSLPAQLDLSTLFRDNVEKLFMSPEEYTMSGLWRLSEKRKWHWRSRSTSDEQESLKSSPTSLSLSQSTIEINPMEIRTFIQS